MIDSTGALRARYAYDPYGRRTKIVGDLEAGFGFTGHYFHPATGLHLALFRAYDSESGRWLNRDPIEEFGGLNLYGFVVNNPLNWVDPYGLSWTDYIPDWIDVADDYAAGYGDSLTFGLTGWLRIRGGWNDTVDPCSMAYQAGQATQVATDLGTLGVSGGLKLAARGVSTAAARSAGRKFLPEAAGQIRHHRFPLAGHPGAGSTLFPSKGLPPSVHSGPGNITKVANDSVHDLHHATFKAAEGVLGVNSALGPARVYNNNVNGGGRCN
jgi:RHS repeat-associated protein